jgi:hypothetical protein
MTNRLYMSCSCLLLLLASTWVEGAWEESLAPEIQARLRAGEVVLEDGETDVNGATASILIFIRAPVERIWATIVSCHDAQIFVAGLQFCEVLDERGDYALTRQVVDKGWATPRLDYTFATERQPYRHMEFRLTAGNLKTMQGSWDFENFADGMLVRHTLVLRPVLPAPRWLVRRNMQQDLPDMMRCIRGLSAGGIGEEGTRGDLLRCPGKVD